MGVVASLVVLYISEMVLAMIFPTPGPNDSLLFFAIMMLIDTCISISIAKMLTGRENTAIAATIFLIGIWFFGPSAGLLGIVVILLMWVASMIVAFM